MSANWRIELSGSRGASVIALLSTAGSAESGRPAGSGRYLLNGELDAPKSASSLHDARLAHARAVIRLGYRVGKKAVALSCTSCPASALLQMSHLRLNMTNAGHMEQLP